MEKISRNQENFIIMTVIYDEIADQVASREHNFRDVDEIITEMTDVLIMLFYYVFLAVSDIESFTL